MVYINEYHILSILFHQETQVMQYVMKHAMMATNLYTIHKNLEVTPSITVGSPIRLIGRCAGTEYGSAAMTVVR